MNYMELRCLALFGMDHSYIVYELHGITGVLRCLGWIIAIMFMNYMESRCVALFGMDHSCNIYELYGITVSCVVWDRSLL